jgi:CheY-like chemotaxis protein/anti-sigma regulatory factor (Ser/Thr protein kinase)
VKPGKLPRASAAPAAPDIAPLPEATHALGGTLDLGRLMSRLSELAATRLFADAAGVWLFERGDSELVLRGDLGFKRPEIVARLAHPPGRDVLGWITDRPGPLLLRELPSAALPEARRWLEAEEVQFAGMRRTAEPRTVDLNQIVKDVLEMTRGRWQDSARAHGAEIVVESDLTPLPQIPGDAAALRELLTNLVLNAIEALPRGGRLTIDSSAAGGTGVIAVTDTGLGMPEDVRLRAHEPFFTTKGVRSTGLGLSVAFGIARRHGGELIIQSEVGHGTTVRVLLPLPSAAALPPPRAASPLPGRPLRILLVDNDDEVRQALAEMLVSHGHTVVAASNGRDALRALGQDGGIDVVITDLVMPAMTGWELADAVKASRPTLPVGVVTGWADVPEAAPATQAAIDFVLSKPVTFEALTDALGRLGER